MAVEVCGASRQLSKLAAENKALTERRIKQRIVKSRSRTLQGEWRTHHFMFTIGKRHFVGDQNIVRKPSMSIVVVPIHWKESLTGFV